MASMARWAWAVTLTALLIPVADAEIGAEREAELRHMLSHDCGACHGMRRSGGLGPPLTPTALTAKSSPALAAIIRQGVPGTPMPPWKALLSAEEARWLADFIKGVNEDGSLRP